MGSRNNAAKATREWLIINGWETNKLHGVRERWRRRTFDENYTWMTITEAIHAQKKWEKFWNN